MPAGDILGAEAAFAECRRIVGEADADRAVAASFAPPGKRPALWALHAFDIETRRIRSLVSQPLPGEIRLQWWRDRLAALDEDADGAGQGSPVASALLATVRRYDLPRDALDRLLEARIFDLYDDPMPARAEFEAYAGATGGAMIMLAAMVLDREAASGIADVAGHAGVAEAATAALRSAPLHRARGQIFVPADILEATGVGPAEWLGGGAPAAPAVAAMSAFAREHLRLAQQGLQATPRSVRPALLPALLSGAYLDRMERRGSSGAEGDVGPLRRSWTSWRSMRA